MNAMEFMNDEYASWDVTYFLNGFLFNRIPLLKKLKWREVLSCRGLYGNLSDKNNPAFQQDFVPFSCRQHTMGHTPYVEAGVGVENYFQSIACRLCMAFDLPKFTKYRQIRAQNQSTHDYFNLNLTNRTLNRIND